VLLAGTGRWILHFPIYDSIAPDGLEPVSADSLLSSCWLVAVSARPRGG
jgi:hypothetical protein